MCSLFLYKSLDRSQKTCNVLNCLEVVLMPVKYVRTGGSLLDLVWMLKYAL